MHASHIPSKLSPLINPDRHAKLLIRWAGDQQSALNYLTWRLRSSPITEHLRRVLRILLIRQETAICVKSQWHVMVLHFVGEYLVVFHGRLVFAVDASWPQLQRVTMAGLRMRCDVLMSPSIGPVLQRVTVEWCNYVGKYEVPALPRHRT